MKTETLIKVIEWTLTTLFFFGSIASILAIIYVLGGGR